MKAIICPKYGPAEVLRIELREDPEPREDEVLINIRAASVTNSDLFIRSSKVDPMLLIPMRLMIGFEEATGAAYGGLLALQALEKNGIEKRKKVLVYGAFGTTGTMAVQIAKAFGAQATGVCGGGKARSSKLKEACARAYRGRPLRLYRRRGLGLRFRKAGQDREADRREGRQADQRQGLRLRGYRRGPQVRRVGAQAGERRGQGKLTL